MDPENVSGGNSGQKSAKPIRAPFCSVHPRLGIGSCREKPFGPCGSVEIVSGEYGNPGSTLYPDASSGLVRSRHGNSVGSMHLPVNPPMLPMLAKRIAALPPGQTWIFEPKWDGFRVLIFRERDEILIQSR